TGLVWLMLGWSLFVTWVGALLDLPQAIVDATPFAALPQLPGGAMEWAPVLAETALAAALIALGILGYRRRDITST
ncbi:MAG: polyketide antibiotic transporter, partial [Micrococcales bacterium]|nr:polyketide antibiotic transporter [Micrococcales bacterium]